MTERREQPRVGSPDLAMPDDLRGPVMDHLQAVRHGLEKQGWGGRTGFGERPAVVVIDLALAWTQPGEQMGSHIDPVIDATCRVIDAARSGGRAM